MRTRFTHLVLLLTVSLGLAAGNHAFAGGPGHSFSRSFGGSSNGGSSNNLRNFAPKMSNGSSSNSSMNMKKFTPSFQQSNNSNKPKINLNGIQSHNLNNVKKLNNFPGMGQIGQKNPSQGLGNIGSKPIAKLPNFGQGSGNSNKNGIGIGIGKHGIGIGIGVGNGSGNGSNNNCHHHVGCYPWWKGHGYCGGYTHGCKTVIVQPVVTPVAVLAPELTSLPTLQVGAKLTMQSSAFSPEPGAVMLQVDKLMFSVQVDDWQAGAVSFTVPVLMMTGPVKADLVAIDQSGNVLVAQAVMLVAAPETAQTAAVNAQ